MQIVASYFPLPQCIEGLKVLVNSLFGAMLHNVPMAPGESWHPDVLKMSLHHPEEVYTWKIFKSRFMNIVNHSNKSNDNSVGVCIIHIFSCPVLMCVCVSSTSNYTWKILSPDL